MKRFLSVLILFSMFVGLFTVPANAKAKTKTLKNEVGDGYYVEKATCTIPYYSKWKLDKETLNSEELIFKTSDASEISVRVLDYDYDTEVGMFIICLSDKKYKDKLMDYLARDFGEQPMSPEMLAKVYSIKKDGHGKYMLLVNLDDRYSVIRPLDGNHLLVYAIDTFAGKVTKSQKSKIVSYAKKASIESSSSVKDTELKVEVTEDELDPDRIIFSSVYSNMAWGHQHNEIIVLGDGRVYYCDFSTSLELGTIGNGNNRDISEKLKEMEPVATMDKEFLLKMYSVAKKVDPEAEFTVKKVRYDGGQTNLYFHAEDGSKVLCSGDGDVRYTIDDPYAKQVEKLWMIMELYCK